MSAIDRTGDPSRSRGSERLAGKVALVTGAASGIGEAITRRFVSEGATVLAFDCSGLGRRLVDALGSAVVPCHGDVTREDDLAAAIGVARERWGRLDVLCNNAGVGGAGAPTEVTMEDFDRVMAINVRAPFMAIRLAIPLMAGGGSIINIASVASFVAAPRMSVYATSKGALLMLTRAIALDYASAGIRVNAICPGAIRTSLLGGDPAALDVAAARHPVGRIGEPDEVAAVAVLLASDECRFATGAAFTVDGGRTAT